MPRPQRPSASRGRPRRAVATPPADSASARRRGDAALAGLRGEVSAARAAFDDPSPAVRATALGALRRAGALDAQVIAAALHDRDPLVRRRACELAPALPGADYLALLDDSVDFVVEAAAFALGEQRDARAVDRLATLARTHADPLCRESAVAALGAIGDPAGLRAVLDALDDVVAIRRRAAVALAAFDADVADDALRRCLEDRDWQVRQIAEDLLGREKG